MRDGRRGGFARWRGSRPFWGGLWVIVGGVVLVVAPLASLPLIVQQGVAGVSGSLFGLLLVAVGVLAWAQPRQRVLLGVVAMLLSLASIVTANFGGFGLGTACGLVGGALLLAWLPAAAPEPSGDREPAPRAERTRVLTALPLAVVVATGPAPGVGARHEDPATAPSSLTAGALTMRGARFGGVVHRRTADGSRPYLKLLMDEAVIDGGTHRFRHSGGTTRQDLPRMTLSGDVVLYVTGMRARLAGVALTFTPALPPPVLPSRLTVTDVRLSDPFTHAARVRIDGFAQRSEA
ncbi:hypothetical protein SAMN05421874_101376 [Nonomuraea maritima]|uniref:Uncharacterized protein n=1 Tax=Nonomuraea maritima TaxID=683260 RepID=A0A1G8SMD0_9ACTN|nr:DUF6114 domain-containing protein [Nonomuraea maritima]SDJ30334.1 hypothetical protein SAMN05421874_101376 [Nonomuraea maritima]